MTDTKADRVKLRGRPEVPNLGPILDAIDGLPGDIISEMGDIPRLLHEFNDKLLDLIENISGVPVEPTERMLDAGQHAGSECLDDIAPMREHMYRHPAKMIWQAMMQSALGLKVDPLADVASQLKAAPASPAAEAVACVVSVENELGEHKVLPQFPHSLSLGQKLYAAHQSNIDAKSADALDAGWVSVEERLPTDHGYYLIVTESGFVTLLQFNLERGWNNSTYAHDKPDQDYWNGTVTHWRELPAPPAMKGE